MIRNVMVVGLVVCGACGDDAGNTPVDDAGGDAAIDAGIDATPFDCPNNVAPSCGTTTAPTIPPGGTSACNPLTQTGCNAGEKCTWIVDQVTPPIGHIGCTAVGTIAEGCPCSIGVAGQAGYDDCVAGAACITGTCKTICDPQGGAPTCATDQSCQAYANVFEIGGTAVAGVCDANCDPLTQCSSGTPVGNACGSIDATAPDRGCYGYDTYSCTSADPLALTLTDRQPPRTNASGNPYLNGCAPGFIPFFFEQTGSTMTLCSGLCAALEIDNTPAHAGNGRGDASAPGKLPTQSEPRIGNATCEIGKKGSHASSTCKFLWPYLEDDQGMLAPAFTPHVDTLGVCMAIEFFQYDSDGNGIGDAPYPDCATLPPRSAATPGPRDDAADWGCQKRANSARAAPALRTHARIPSGEPMTIARHPLD